MPPAALPVIGSPLGRVKLLLQDSLACVPIVHVVPARFVADADDFPRADGEQVRACAHVRVDATGGAGEVVILGELNVPDQLTGRVVDGEHRIGIGTHGLVVPVSGPDVRDLPRRIECGGRPTDTPAPYCVPSGPLVVSNTHRISPVSMSMPCTFPKN